MLYLFAKVFKVLTPVGVKWPVFMGCLLIGITCGSPVFGETGTARKLERLKENYGETQQKVTENRKEIQAFTEKERQVLAGLEEIDQSLDQTRKEINASGRELRALETEMAAVQAESEEVENAVRSLEAHADKRMVSLYKLGNLGRMRVLAAADSLTDFLRRRKALECILGSDRMVLGDYGRRMATLAALHTQLERQRQQRAVMEEDLRRKYEEINIQKSRREDLLASIRDRKVLKKTVLASLQQKATELDRKIRSFRIESPEEEKPAGEGSGAFRSLKGLLKMPVKGTVIKAFGPNRNKEYGVVNFQSGIEIEADRGEPVRAVYGGRVIFSNWFKGYGNMMIIDHEDHYYTLYAQAEELFKQKGDRVHADEVIGTVGESGDMAGAGLHFEVRHHGKPVDPLKWVKQ